jgi:hypothetical protein
MSQHGTCSTKVTQLKLQETGCDMVYESPAPKQLLAVEIWPTWYFGRLHYIMYILTAPAQRDGDHCLLVGLNELANNACDVLVGSG